MTSAVSRLKGLAAIAATSFATAAFAGLPTGTLTFVTPSGTVGANDTIDVWVRFTLDANSAPLTFSTDAQTGLLTGFAAADLPTMGSYWDATLNQYVEAPFAKITGAGLNTLFTCYDNFTNNCSSTANYGYGFGPSQAGVPGINFTEEISLAPGQSIDYVFAHFTPQAGGANAGTYKFYRSGLFLYFRGVDAAGHQLLYADLDPGPASTVLAQTCPAVLTDDCAFIRTVTAVPEPATYGLMALGLGVVGALARRRLGAAARR